MAKRSRRTKSATTPGRSARVTSILTPASATSHANDLMRELDIGSERDALREGDALAASGDFEAARLAYARAWTVIRVPDLLFKLADAEERSDHPVDAALHYRELLALTEPDTSYVRTLATYASFHRETLDALRGRAASAYERLLAEHVAQLVIETTSLSASAFVDGQPVARGAPVLVEPGEHVIRVRDHGAIVEQRVDAEAGGVARITLDARRDAN